MKMIPGSAGATIADYGSYIHNCTTRQMPYKVPVPTLQEVQLYIGIGGQMPSTALYQLIHTCGPTAGEIDTLATPSYVIGQDTNENWYGVFKNFIGQSPTCFVIAITIDDQIFFSEEYCIENPCAPLVMLKGCYGNLDNKLSYNCEGIYFGTHATENDSFGDTTIVYQHKLYLRGVEVTLSGIKNSFKQGRTRNFRTEKEKLYQFMAELVPEWYIPEVDAVFYRGEVFVDAVKYLVNDTQFEKVEDCKRMWKPTATFKESCYQSFSCEADPCGPPLEESEIDESEQSGSGEESGSEQSGATGNPITGAFGNDQAELCTQMLENVWLDPAHIIIQPGSFLYYDEALTIPVTGFLYVIDSGGNIYFMDPFDASVGAPTGFAC